MVILSPITTPVKHVVCFCKRVGRNMSQLSSKSHSPCISFGGFRPGYVSLTVSRRSFNRSANGFQAFQGCFSKQRTNSNPLLMKSIVSSIRQQLTYRGVPLPCQKISMRPSVPKQGIVTKIRWNTGSANWMQRTAFAGAFFGLSLCLSISQPVYAEPSRGQNNDRDDCNSSSVRSVHGKKVYTNYSITGIPGDGRCLFRSVVHGACLRSGKPSPSENFQRQLADELRAKVADEFVKRREETEWFIEGDFETYVSQIRKPHVWGGEPELFMASLVLRMPITVYMRDVDAGGLIAIAEYGQEYGKEDPIRVLYHGFGHYDALQIPGIGGKSRLQNRKTIKRIEMASELLLSYFSFT